MIKKMKKRRKRKMKLKETRKKQEVEKRQRWGCQKGHQSSTQLHGNETFSNLF